MELTKQLLILATNQPGTLANICGALSDESINIQAISIVDHVDHALVRMVVDDPVKSLHLLGEAGLPVLEDTAIKLTLDGGPGALEKVALVIADIGLNIHYAYASEPPSGGAAGLILKTSSDEKALQALKKMGAD